MKLNRKQLRKMILNEMIDPGSLALGAGVATGLALLYTHIFGEEPESDEQAAEAIKQHVDKELAQSRQPLDNLTPSERWQRDTGIISHRDYFSDQPDHVKRKYGWTPGDDE